MKRFRTIMCLCGALLCAAVGTASAQTAGGTTGTLTWELVDGAFTITGEGAMPDYNHGTVPWGSHARSITTVVIGNSVTSIGNYAFYECTELTSVTIGNSVTAIGDNAFGNCLELPSVTIPNSVTSIGNYAFYVCSGLTYVTIGNSVTSIGEGAFQGCSGLTSVTIPNSVTSIGDNAFDYCRKLASVTIGSSVTTIGSNAFSSCSELTSVTIPNSVISIGNYAFYNCTELTSVTIGNSVISIGNSAFYSCTELTSVIIGSSVTTIGSYAFENCTSLNEVINHATTPQVINADVFEYVDISSCTLRVPEGTRADYLATNVWKDFGIVVDVSVTGVELNKTELSLKVNETETLEATVQPANASNQTVTWESSNSAVATVDETTGMVTAVSAGTATITVTTDDGGFTATCEVTVTQPVTGVELNKTSLSLKVGETETLEANVLPTNASNQTVTFSSNNPEVATVDETSGMVTAVSAGTATITVTTDDGGFTATCEVTVTQPVTGVELNETSLSLNVGDTETLEATVLPANANNQTVTWESSNSAVATVDETTGMVTAVSAGTATITVTTDDGGFTATCEVTVTQPVTGVELNKTSLSLSVGETEMLEATVLPANANNQTVTWISNAPEVATVNETSGLVTAVSAGTATITVTTDDGGFTATCEVTVTQPVTGVELNKTELSLSVGETEMLEATVLPANANNQTVTWISSNPEVATVDETSGLVTAVSAGTATITVTTDDGGFTATCEVTVGGSGISDNTFANVTVYSNGSSICITNNSGVALKSVQITDMQGRVVYDGNASDTITVNGAGGIYVVKLVSEDDRMLSTKVHLTR